MSYMAKYMLIYDSCHRMPDPHTDLTLRCFHGMLRFSDGKFKKINVRNVTLRSTCFMKWWVYMVSESVSQSVSVTAPINSQRSITFPQPLLHFTSSYILMLTLTIPRTIVAKFMVPLITPFEGHPCPWYPNTNTWHQDWLSLWECYWNPSLYNPRLFYG